LISGCAEDHAGYVLLVCSLLDTLMANLNHFSKQMEDSESSYACLANLMDLVHRKSSCGGQQEHHSFKCNWDIPLSLTHFA
jgi:hypothetical protein